MERIVIGFIAWAVVGATFAQSADAQGIAATGDLTALRQQLKALQARDQQQIEALRREVRTLSKMVMMDRKPRSQGGTGLAAAAQSSDLRGRSGVPPYTSTGPGTPGKSPVAAAAPIASGGNRISLTLSGQVDRAFLWGDDGINSKLRQVDNNQSSTRFRIVGEAKPFADTVAGMNLETEIRPNSSASVTLTQNLPQSASTSTFTIRQAEVYGGSPRYGEVRLGFGSTASYLTAENDLSGTAVASDVQVSDFNGGFAFRQKGAALVPGGTGGTLVLSPAGSYGPAVGSVFNYFDGLGRDARIRFDSPVWHGFQVSTSVVDGDAFDLAGRFARDYGTLRVVGSLGLGFATGRHHTQPGAYGYAGVPAGAGGISLAGTNASPGSPTVADVSANGSNQFDGSISALFKDGFSMTFAGGVRDPQYRDPTGRSLSPNLFYAKLGYQRSLIGLGTTAFSLNFAQNEDLIFAGDRARGYGVAVVQNIDRLATELFVSGRYETLDRDFASYDPIIALMAGARVTF